MYIAFKNQYSIVLLQIQFFLFNFFPLTLVGDRAIWLSYLDSAMSELQESPWIPYTALTAWFL
jgi:hypothetical protein